MAGCWAAILGGWVGELGRWVGIREMEVGYQSEVSAVERGRKKSDENLGWRSLNNRKEKDEKNEGAQDLYEPLADTSGSGRADAI